MDLRTRFSQESWRAGVLGELLDPRRAKHFEALWRWRKHQAERNPWSEVPADIMRQWRPDHIPDEVREILHRLGPELTPRKVQEAIRYWLLTFDQPVRNATVRVGGGRALWVQLARGRPPSRPPSLEDVAGLLDGGMPRWATVIERYGLPVREEGWVVAESDVRQLLRIPWGDLQQIARWATLLHACEQAAVERCEVLRKVLPRLSLFTVRRVAVHFKPNPSGPVLLTETFELGEDEPVRPPHDPRRFNVELLPSAPGEILDVGFEVGLLPERDSDAALMGFARRAIARSLEEVLKTAQPKIRGGVHQHVGGWWPLVVVRRFLDRSQYARVCAAPDCSNLLPPHRKKYCSERCRWRHKKQEQRKLPKRVASSVHAQA